MTGTRSLRRRRRAAIAALTVVFTGAFGVSTGDFHARFAAARPGLIAGW